MLIQEQWRGRDNPIWVNLVGYFSTSGQSRAIESKVNPNQIAIFRPASGSKAAASTQPEWPDN
jgi:hypothetical protein